MIDGDKGIQGNADGLCGFYGLINFLILKKLVQQDPDTGATVRQEAFRYLAEAADRLRLLTAQKLSSGYEWPDLIAIFNEYTRYNFVNYTAVSLGRLYNYSKIRDEQSLIGPVIVNHGAVLALTEHGGHWVLAYKSDQAGDFYTIDPTHGKTKTKLGVCSNIELGVVLRQSDTQLLKDNL